MAECEDEEILIREEEDSENLENLKTYHVELIQDLNPDRQYIFSYLISKKVLDNEDIQLINHGPTNQAKNAKLLEMLPRKGPQAIRHFIDALENEHPYLYKLITNKEADFMKIQDVTGFSSVLNWERGSVLPDNESIYHQLEASIKEYHNAISRLNKSETERKRTQDDLKTAQFTIESKQKKIQLLEEQSKRLASEESELVGRHEIDRDMKIYNLHQLVIALQSKQLAQTESIVMLKEENQALKNENNQCKKKLHGVQLSNSIHDRRIIERKFSEQIPVVKKSPSQNQKVDVEDIERIREERDNIRERYNSFRMWSEMVNRKYNIKEEELEKCRLMSKNDKHEHKKLKKKYSDLQSQYDDAKLTIDDLAFERDTLKKRVKALESSAQLTKAENERLNKLSELSKTNDEVIKQQKINISDLQQKISEKDKRIEEIWNQFQKTNKSLLEEKRKTSETSHETIPDIDQSTFSSDTSGCSESEEETLYHDEDKTTIKRARLSRQHHADLRTSCELLSSMKRKFPSHDEANNIEENIGDNFIIPVVEDEKLTNTLTYQQIHLLYPPTQDQLLVSVGRQGAQESKTLPRNYKLTQSNSNATPKFEVAIVDATEGRGVPYQFTNRSFKKSTPIKARAETLPILTKQDSIDEQPKGYHRQRSSLINESDVALRPHSANGGKRASYKTHRQNLSH